MFLLGTPASAAEDSTDDLTRLFRDGIAAIEEAQRAEGDRRDELLDDAIASFREMLVADPKLVRVHLELARAFFLKGEDRLAKRHFEQVLAGDVPQPVAYNVRRFLSQIRARRRWDLHAGFALAPDTNIGAGSDKRIIYINVGGARLPFTRDAEDLTTSGIGLSLWTGGEYQYPLGEGLRLRAGQPVRPDVRVGACGAALAPGPEHGGERAGERAAALERRGAGPRRPRGPSRGRAPVYPPRDRERPGVVARPELSNPDVSGRLGRRRLAQRGLGVDPDRAGECCVGLGTRAPGDGALASRAALGTDWRFRGAPAGIHRGRIRRIP